MLANFGRGTKQETQLGFDFNEHIPTGQLNDKYKENIHLPFSRNEVDFINKRYHPVVPEIAGYAHDKKYKKQELTQTNPDVSVFNNLYNFNPTLKEMSYYAPHETEKLFNHPTDKPRFEKEFVYNNDIPNEIEGIKQNTTMFYKLPQHSMTIQRRNK